MKFDKLLQAAEDQDVPDEKVSKVALREIYDAMKPYIGSGATVLVDEDANRLLNQIAEVVAVLVRANRLGVAGAICTHLHTALGPTPPCNAATPASPCGSSCPTGGNKTPDCGSCPLVTDDDPAATGEDEASKKGGGRKD